MYRKLRDFLDQKFEVMEISGIVDFEIRIPNFFYLNNEGLSIV